MSNENKNNGIEAFSKLVKEASKMANDGSIQSALNKIGSMKDVFSEAAKDFLKETQGETGQTGGTPQENTPKMKQLIKLAELKIWKFSLCLRKDK